MADDLDQGYIQTRQTMRAYQAQVFGMEPQQQGSDVFMGAQVGGTPKDGEKAGPQGQQPTDQQPVTLAPDATLPPEQPAAPQPNTITVDTPEVAAVKQQFAADMQKMASGESGVEALGRGGKALAEAARPGFVVAAKTLGMDDNAAEAVGDAFVQFMGGLPGETESDFRAGIETALAALPVIGAVAKTGEKGVAMLAANKDAIVSEFQKAVGLLKSERGSIPLGGGGSEKIWYHGTTKQFDQFAPTERVGRQPFGEAYFFSSISGPTVKQFARDGGRVIQAQLDLKNPMHVGSDVIGDPRAEIKAIEQAKAAGHDGIIGTTDDGEQIAVVFSNSQIKQMGGGAGKPPTIPPAGASAPGDEPLSSKALALISKREESKQAYGFAVEGFLAELTKQRRGPVLKDEAVRKLADQSGFTLQDLLDLKPGTVLAPEIQLAAREVYDKAADRLRASAKTYLEVADPDALADFAEAFAQAGAATTRIIGTYSEAGRTFRGLNQKYPTLKTGVKAQEKDPEFSIQDAYIQQMYQFFRGMEEKSKMGGFARPRGSGVEQDMVTPGHLAEMVSKLKSREELMTFARAATKPTWGDMLYEVWINGLLSGPITHSTNIISNAATLLWNIPERQLASMLKPGAVRPGEAAAMVGGVMESVGDAWRMAWKAFKEEQPQFGQAKLETPRRAITADALELTGSVGAAVDFLGNAVRLPGRFLMAGDDFFKAIAFRAELRALAKRQAFREVNELGLTGKDAARKAKEIEHNILTDPPESIKRDAQEFAAYTTFTRELGENGQKIQALAATPIGRIILPFVRTPTNIFKFAGERTPLALASRAVRDELAAGGERQALALAKIGLGSMTMGFMATLAANGMITGGGPKDKVLRKQLELEGWQPYSFKVGNEYISFARIEPLGSLIGMAADAADLMGQLDKKDSAELASALTVALSRNIANKTFVKGLAGTLNAVTSQDVHVVKSFLEKELPTLMPYSSAMGQTAKNIDPVMRDVQSILDAFKAKVPGWSDDLPPMRNLWGDKILLQGGFGPDLVSPLYQKEIKNDPVAHELNRLAYPFTAPPRHIDGVQLPPKVYDRFAELAGKGSEFTGGQSLHGRMQQTMNTSLYKQAADGPDGGKVTLLREDIRFMRDMAALALEKENRDFAQARQMGRMKAATKFDQNARAKQGAAPTLQ